MVDPKIGDKVPDQEVVPAIVGAKIIQNSAGQGDTDVTEHNQMGVLVLKKRSARIEVVDTATITVVLALATALLLSLVVIVASNVGQKVVGPAHKLLGHKHHQSKDGSLLGELTQFVDHLTETASLLLASARDKYHVALQMASGLVVLAVGHLPTEVGDEQSRVDNPADNVVVELGGGEGAMAALVSQDPETCSKETLEESVQTPEDEADWVRWDGLGSDKVVEEVEGGGQASAVTEDIAQTKKTVALKTVLGNGIPNILDGVVRDLERVAIRVYQLSIVDLGSGIRIERGHGREGSRGSRSSR